MNFQKIFLILPLCLRRMKRQFCFGEDVEHIVQEMLISVHGIHGYNMFSYSRFEAHWELLKILPWSQVNGLGCPVIWMSRQFCQFVFCTKSLQLLRSIMGQRQAGKVNDSTPCVTVSPAVTTLAPCDSRTGSSLPQSSPSPFKTSFGAAHMARLAMGLCASFEAGTSALFCALPKPNCFWGDPYDSATLTSFLNPISNKQTSHNAALRVSNVA